MAAAADSVARARHSMNRGMIAWGGAALVLLTWARLTNAMLFHTLSGLFAATAAASVFVIAWSSRDLAEDAFLLFLGTAYLGIASLDVLNTLTHQGLGVFPWYPEDVGRQLRVASSLLNAFALLIAPGFLYARPRAWLLLGAVGAVVAVVVLAILELHLFPSCVVVLPSTFSFRAAAAFATIAMLGGATFYFRRFGQRLESRFRHLLQIAIVAALGAEFGFVLVDCGLLQATLAWKTGIFCSHVLRIATYFLVCSAVIETGLRAPYGILFRRLVESEERFRVLVDEAPVAVSLLGCDGSFEYINRQFIDLFGYSLAEIPTKDKWFERAFPDPSYRARMVALSAEDSAPAGPSSSSRERIVYVRCREGTTKTIRLRNSSLETGRQIVSYEDITEEKRAEMLLRILHDLGVALISARAVNEIVSSVLDALTQIEGVDSAAVYLREPSTGGFDLAQVVGVSAEFAVTERHYGRDSDDVARFMEGRPLFAEFTEAHPPVSPSVRTEGLRTSALIPFLNDGKVIGVVVAASHRLEAMSATVRRTLESISSRVGLAVGRIQAQEELREREERLGFIVRYDPGAIAVYDKDLRYLYVSDRYLRDRRVEREDIIGQYRYNVFPDTPKRWREAHQRCLDGNIERSEEDLIVHSDGSVDFVRWEFRPWHDARGQVGGMIAYTEVITERKLAEQRLRDSEERYRSLFSTMREAFALHEIICDAQGIPVDYRFLEANAAFESITGLKAADIIGKTVLEIMPGTEPYWVDVYGRVALTGQPVSFEHFSRVLDKHFQVTASSPKPGQFSTIFLDITARKQAEDALTRSEERLKLALDSASDGLWDWDVPSGNAYFSPRYYTMLGYEPNAFPAQWAGWDQLVHPDDRERVLRDIQRVLDPGSEVTTLEFRMRAKDGGWRWILSRGSVVQRDSEGRAVRLVGTHTDITERKAAEDEVSRYHLRLEELVEKRTQELEESREHARRHERLASIGTLAAGIAHEINNPIGGILLAAQNVQRLAAKPEQHALVDSCVRDIIESAERCREIVQNLMSFARQRPTRKAPSDLNACVHRSARLTEQYIWDLGGTLELDLAESLPHVLVNPLAMEQVLVNLMRNAAESGNKGFKIIVRTQLADKRVRVIVSDNGRGISEDQLKHVFDPFYTTRLARGGTGLGLSIVHGIVTEQGGIIDVHSRLGSGTTFTVDLPMAVRDPGDKDHGEGSHC